MKKIFLLLLLLALFALLFTACDGGTEGGSSEDNMTASTSTDGGHNTSSAFDSSTPDSTPSPDGNAFLSKTPEEMLRTLLADDAATLSPMYEDLTKASNTRFKTDFFIDRPDSVKSVNIAQPIIGTIPFFMGILKVDPASDAQAIAEDILENVNYGKLICVRYQKAYTRAVGDTVILILDGDTGRADRLVAAFDSLAA